MKNQRVARSAVLPCLAALIPTVVVGAAALAVSAPSGGSARPARALQAVVAPVRAALAPAAPASTPLQLADFNGFGTASPLHHPNSVFQVRSRIALPHAGTSNVPLSLVPFGTGEVVRITNASGQTVRAPQSAGDTSIAPNQPLTFTVQLNNNNTNTAATVQAVYIQFKDPDSLYQDTNLGGTPREHKVFTKDQADYDSLSTVTTTNPMTGRTLTDFVPIDSGSATAELYNGQDGQPYQSFSSNEGSFYEQQRGAIGGDDATSAITVGRVDSLNHAVTVTGDKISGGTTTATRGRPGGPPGQLTTTGGTVTGGTTVNGVTTGGTVTGGVTTGGTNVTTSGGVTITTTGGTTTNATISGNTVTTTTNGVTTTTGGTGTGGVTTGGTSTATVDFQNTNNPILVTDGTYTHSLDNLAIDNYDFPQDAEKAYHPWGQEYECQYLNANPAGNTAGYTGANQDAADTDYGTPYYLAGYDDQYTNPFPNPRPEWLALHSTNPSDPNNNQFQATWSPPYSPSDYYIDVIVSYTAVDNGTSASHWRIFDNIWGFSTQSFDPTPANSRDILVVSDNALGQKFGASAPNSAGLVNLRPTFYGAESYFTDYDTTQLPNATEYYVPPPSGRSPHVGSGNAQVNLDDQRPIEFIQPLGQGFGSGGVLNGLGVGSYDSSGGDAVVSREAVTANTGDTLPRSQAYSIWRVLSRGRVPTSVYQAYEPTFQSQPAVKDPVSGFTAPAADGGSNNVPEVTAATRCILWSPPSRGRASQCLRVHHGPRRSKRPARLRHRRRAADGQRPGGRLRHHPQRRSQRGSRVLRQRRAER